MYDSRREMIEALGAMPDTLRGLVGGLGQAEAALRRAGADEWSALEVVCHLRDAEERFYQRMLSLRDDPAPLIEGFDQETWARERNYAADNLLPALAAFSAHRARHLAALGALTPAQWERGGVHATLGAVTIANHTLHVLWHDAIHLAQIARQLPPCDQAGGAPNS